MSAERDQGGRADDRSGQPPGGGWRRLVSWLRGDQPAARPALPPGDPPEPALLGVKEEL